MSREIASTVCIGRSSVHIPLITPSCASDIGELSQKNQL